MNKKTTDFLCASRRMLLESELSEHAISTKLGVSESYFRARYLQYFGLPPKKYIRTVHMKKAQTLLRTTDKSVSEVAHSLFYVNVSKFSCAFKKQFSLTPSQYRKKIRFWSRIP